MIQQPALEAFPQQYANNDKFYESSLHFQTPGLGFQKYFHINAHSVQILHQATKNQSCVLAEFDQEFKKLKCHRFKNKSRDNKTTCYTSVIPKVGSTALSGKVVLPMGALRVKQVGSGG